MLVVICLHWKAVCGCWSVLYLSRLPSTVIG